MKRKLRIKLLAAAAGLLAGIFLSAPVNAQSSGGDFTIRQAVASNGGGAGTDAGNTFFLTGTLGQTFAGNSSGKSFNVYGGFLFPQAIAPTSAEVTVGGRILTNDGRGIRSVYVSMTGPAGERQTALSNSFGYYRFSDVRAGGTYIFTVSAKRFQFSQAMQVRFVEQDTVDINFVAVD